MLFRIKEQTGNNLTREYENYMTVLGSRMNNQYRDPASKEFIHFGHVVYSPKDMKDLMKHTLTTSESQEQGPVHDLWKTAGAAPLSVTQAYAAIILSHPSAINSAVNGQSHVWQIFGPGGAGKTELAKTTTEAFNNMLSFSKLAIDQGMEHKDIVKNLSSSAEHVFSPIFKNLGMDVDYNKWATDFHTSAQRLFSVATSDPMKFATLQHEGSMASVRGTTESQSSAPVIGDAGNLEMKSAYPMGSIYGDDMLSNAPANAQQAVHTNFIGSLGEKATAHLRPLVIWNSNLDKRMLKAHQEQVGRSKDDIVEGPFGRQGVGLRIGPLESADIDRNTNFFSAREQKIGKIVGEKNQYAVASLLHKSASNPDDIAANTAVESFVSASSDRKKARENIHTFQNHMQKMDESLGGEGKLGNILNNMVVDPVGSVNDRLFDMRDYAKQKGVLSPGENVSLENLSLLHRNMSLSTMNRLKEDGTLSPEVQDKLKSGADLSDDERQKVDLAKNQLNHVTDLVNGFGSALGNVANTTGIALQLHTKPMPKISDSGLLDLMDGPKAFDDYAQPYVSPNHDQHEAEYKDSEGASKIKDKIHAETSDPTENGTDPIARNSDAAVALKNLIEPDFNKSKYNEIGHAEKMNNSQLCSMKKVLEEGDVSLGEVGEEHIAFETSKIKGNRTLSQVIDTAQSFQKYVKGDEDSKGWARDFVIGAFRGTPVAHRIMKGLGLYGQESPKMEGFGQHFSADEHQISGFENHSDQDYKNAAELLNSFGKSQAGAMEPPEIHGQVLNSLDQLASTNEENSGMHNKALHNFEKLMTMVSDTDSRNKLAEGLDDDGEKAMRAIGNLKKNDFAYNPPDEEKQAAMQGALKEKFCGNEGALNNAISKGASEAMPDAVMDKSNYAAGLNNTRINRNLTGLV